VAFRRFTTLATHCGKDLTGNGKADGLLFWSRIREAVVGLLLRHHPSLILIAGANLLLQLLVFILQVLYPRNQLVQLSRQLAKLQHGRPLLQTLLNSLETFGSSLHHLGETGVVLRE
jgi:hypothetical protein